MIRLRKTLCSLALLALCFSSKATIYTIGTGTASLTQDGVSPFSNYYEDNRTQYLFLASELTAAGASSGLISSLAFNFTSLGFIPAENVNIKIGTTTDATLSGITEGLAVVYSASSISPVLGWNTYSFSSPFLWDGTSNIIIEVCRDNNIWDDNYGVQGMQYPSGSFYTYAYYDDMTAGCSMTSGLTLTNANRRRRPNVQLEIIPATPCSGTPVAGLSASVATVCTGTPFTLNATPGYMLGITYQYQVSTDGGANWSDLGGSGSAYTVASQSIASQYRVIVSCTGNGADTSGPVSVAQSPSTACYCIPTYFNGCSDGDEINDFTLTGEAGSAINHLGSGCSAGAYGDFTAMSVNVAPGNTYSGSMTTSYGFFLPEEYYTIWIDWNNDGVLDASEQVANGGPFDMYAPATFSITVPANATAGNHRMRVRLAYDEPFMSACTAYDYGETHDYTVNVIGGCTTPVVNLGPDVTDCDGATITLDAGNPGLTYIWSTGATTQTIDVTTAGSYSVTVTDGACSASDTVEVSFNALPTVALGNDTTICAGESLILNAGNAGATYVWSTGATTQTINVTTAGSYSVNVTSNGCTGSDEITIGVNDYPVVNLGNDTMICISDNLTLDAGNPGATYLWSTGDNTQTIPVNTPGTYSVVVTNGSCTSGDMIVIDEIAAPIAGGISVSGTSPDFSFSSSFAANAETFTWYFGDGGTNSGETVTHSYTADGVYEVTLVLGNTCGVTDTATVSVTVSGVGINSINVVAHNVHVYPNPSNGLTTVEAKGATISNLEVVDHLGRILLRSQPDATRTVIDVKGIAQGIYTLRIQTTKGDTTMKLVISDR